MKRLAGLVLAACMIPAAGAAESDPHEGRYREIKPAQPTDVGPNQVEVIEFFAYSCPHCFQFEPMIENWKADKPDNVVFKRIPAVGRDLWRLHGRAFYTAKVLGVVDEIHRDFFREIHVNNNMLDSKDAIRAFFVEHGVDGEKFDSTFESFSVETRLRRADTLARRYKLRGTPTVIVNGKYYISGTQDLAGSLERIMPVADYLARQELKAVQ